MLPEKLKLAKRKSSTHDLQKNIDDMMEVKLNSVFFPQDPKKSVFCAADHSLRISTVHLGGWCPVLRLLSLVWQDQCLEVCEPLFFFPQLLPFPRGPGWTWSRPCFSEACTCLQVDDLYQTPAHPALEFIQQMLTEQLLPGPGED